MIAIVDTNGSFSKYWIQYCQKHGIEYKTVNPYSTDIIKQVQGCDSFMWHFHHNSYKDMQCARNIIFALETIGVHCFPDYRTCWHFDDKVAQKYLLETIGAPLVNSYVFYDKNEATTWAEQTSYPKVFKLKGGAGATNVKLAHDKNEAKALIRQCFGKGFRQYRWREQFAEACGKYKRGKATLREVLRPLKLALKRHPTEFDHYRQREMGYAYFQDFVPNNKFDTRVVVIGDKAFALKRFVRPNDFRASGSGDIIYDKNQIDERCVSIAFATKRKLKAQCIAFDFITNEQNDPMIVEMSYGFTADSYFDCPGYWSENMGWHESQGLDLCGWMVEETKPLAINH
ncbi:MAG: hypothetical protein MJ002_00365 [Paludibacteraceae bacterium]|nr:hypothetical protein [Paludibacteraceae bacterium]